MIFSWVMECQACRALFFGEKQRHCNNCRSAAITKTFSFFQSKAHRTVHAAIRNGSLRKIDGSIPCADCGNPAQCYDHRDYSKPLSVDPVCFSCNLRRGPANGLIVKPAIKTRSALCRKIREMGVPAFAKAVGVTERAAMGWMYRQRKPRPEQAGVIMDTLGLRWDEIYPPKNGSNAA